MVGSDVFPIEISPFVGGQWLVFGGVKGLTYLDQFHFCDFECPTLRHHSALMLPQLHQTESLNNTAYEETLEAENELGCA